MLIWTYLVSSPRQLPRPRRCETPGWGASAVARRRTASAGPCGHGARSTAHVSARNSLGREARTTPAAGRLTKGSKVERVRTNLPLSADQSRQPVGCTSGPSPLSGELDEIVEYMRFIGDRRGFARP